MKKKHTKEFRANHKIIKEAFIKFLKQNKTPPTLDELAKLTGFHFQTVNNHLDELSLEDIAPRFKLMGEEVLTGMVQSAMKGESKSAKLFFKLIYKWNEKQEIDITVKKEYNFSKLNNEELEMFEYLVKKLEK